MTSRHFVFIASSNAPSITSRGTEAEWLEDYKLSQEDEVYLPWPDENCHPEPDDVLWMQINDEVIASVDIDRVVRDELNDRLELWFTGTDIEHVVGLKSTLTENGEVPSEVVADWLKHSGG